MILITGNVVGNGIFTTIYFLAAELPHLSLCIELRILGGLMTICEALTYAELAGMFPLAGERLPFFESRLRQVGRVYFRLGNLLGHRARLPGSHVHRAGQLSEDLSAYRWIPGQIACHLNNPCNCRFHKRNRPDRLKDLLHIAKDGIF
jgi:hypothetical protein